MAKFGIAALCCYAIHATFHLLHYRPEELLWACHLGAALVGVGLLCHSQQVNGIGVLFLMMGTPLWVMDVAGGGEFYPTSLFTHVGGPAIGLYGVGRLGIGPGAWWKAVVALIVLILICRVVTPARANVNVAFAIYPSMEKIFSSHPVYLAAMMAMAAAYFFICEYALRRWLAPEPAPKGVA